MTMKNKIKRTQKPKKTFKERILKIGNSLNDGKLRDPSTYLLVFQLLALTMALVFQKDNLTSRNIIIFISLIVVVFLANKIVLKITDGDNYLLSIDRKASCRERV